MWGSAWHTKGDNVRADVSAPPKNVYVLVDRTRGTETPVRANSDTTARRAYYAWLAGERLPASASILDAVPDVVPDGYVERIVLRPRSRS